MSLILKTEITERNVIKLKILNKPTATGVSFPSASILVASN